VRQGGGQINPSGTIGQGLLRHLTPKQAPAKAHHLRTKIIL